MLSVRDHVAPLSCENDFAIIYLLTDNKLFSILSFYHHMIIVIIPSYVNYITMTQLEPFLMGLLVFK